MSFDIVEKQGSVSWIPGNRAVALCHSTRETRVRVKRDETFSNIPCMGGLGYANIPTFWMGVSGPPKLPASIVELGDRTVQEIYRDQEYLERLKNLGLRPMYLDAAEMREVVLKDMRETQETKSK